MDLFHVNVNCTQIAFCRPQNVYKIIYKLYIRMFYFHCNGANTFHVFMRLVAKSVRAPTTLIETYQDISALPLRLTILHQSWLVYPMTNEVVEVGWVYWFHSVHLSVCLSVHPPRIQCPLRNSYSSGWILFILDTNGYQYEKVCRTQWPLILTYIFNVIQTWLCNKTSEVWHIFSMSDLQQVKSRMDSFHAW